MTRIRIFIGLFALIMGVPLFVYMMAHPESPGGAYAPVCGLVAIGLALLYPARWVEE